MKKLISVLLCICVLFSCAVFASAEESPQLNLTASKASADAFSAAPGQYVNFLCSFWNCSYFESFEILITYNPEVLEYSAVYPLPKTDVVKHAIDCTVIQPGKLQVIGNNTCGYGGSNEFDPFCLKVIGNGDTNISVELVSFRTADGEVENVNFDATITNFTVSGCYVRYDLDGDNLVTAEDARLALRFATGLETASLEQCRAAGIVSADKFTAESARYILRAAVGLEADFDKLVVSTEWATDYDTGYIVYSYSDGSYGTVGPFDGRNKPDWI